MRRRPESTPETIVSLPGRVGPGEIGEHDEDYVAVIERVMRSPETRRAWLLGFITGSSLAGADGLDGGPSAG